MLTICGSYRDLAGRSQQVDLALAAGVTGLAAVHDSGGLLELVAGVRALDGDRRLTGHPAHPTPPSGPSRAVRAVWMPDPDALWSEQRVLAALRAGARAAGGERSRARFGALVDALELGPDLDATVGSLDAARRRRVQLARALLAGPDWLAVELARGTPPAERRDLIGCLRWAVSAAGVSVLYSVWSTAELEDFADGLIVHQDGRFHGPAPPWSLLGRTLRGELAEAFAVESVLPAVVDYLDEEGRWLRLLVGGQEVHAPFLRLSPGWRGRITVGASSVLLLREPLSGSRLTNQISGRLVEIGDLLGRCVASVEIAPSVLLRALVEPDTVREQGFVPGVTVICVFEPAAVSWSSGLASGTTAGRDRLTRQG